MQVMAQYKKKVGENPNENGHATGMSKPVDTLYM